MVDLGVGPYVHEKTSTRFPLYTRGNAGEVWPEVAYPLSISLTRTFDDPVTAAMLQTGVVHESDVIEGSGCAAGAFGGYMYLNLSLSRVIAVRSPGVSIEESDAVYLGSEGSAPPHTPNKADRSWRASLNAVKFMLGVLRTKSLDELRDDQRLVAGWKARVPELLEQDDEELLATIRGLVPVGMELFSRHLEVTGKAGAAVQFLSAFCEKQLDDRELALSLLSSLGDIDSAAPSRALWRLGRQVAASSTLTALFDDGLDGLVERLGTADEAAFASSFAAFLEEFGARGPNEWESASPTWGTEPRLALALIDRLRLADEKQDPEARAVRLTAERESLTIETRAKVRWPLRRQFDKALAAATLFSTGRERSKTTVVELIHVNRLLARELASRVAARTEGGQWDDMWFCLEEELDAYLADPGSFHETVASRRATREALSARVPPFVFEGDMPPVDTWPLRSDDDGLVALEAGGVDLRSCRGSRCRPGSGLRRDRPVRSGRSRPGRCADCAADRPGVDPTLCGGRSGRRRCGWSDEPCRHRRPRVRHALRGGGNRCLEAHPARSAGPSRRDERHGHRPLASRAGRRTHCDRCRSSTDLRPGYPQRVLLPLLFLVAGIVILTIAADHFVEGAVALADVFKISPVVVGALVIGFGTSLPEMLVSGVAAVQGDADLGVGNVVGSNVANLTLVLGLAALISVISIDSITRRRELPLCVGAVTLFAILVQGGFRRYEGIILLVCLAGVLLFLLRNAHDHDDESPIQEHEGQTALASAVRTTLGLIGTVGGAWLLVDGGTDLADEVGLTGGFVGLTLVAIGTSLPEMVTAVVSARKGETDLIIGNLLGSNIFNSLAVGAVLGLLGPGPLEDGNLAGLATLIMLVVVAIAAVFLYTGGRVVRWQAATLLAIYLAAMPFTVSTTADCTEEPTAQECTDAGEVAVGQS